MCAGIISFIWKTETFIYNFQYDLLSFWLQDPWFFLHYSCQTTRALSWYQPVLRLPLVGERWLRNLFYLCRIHCPVEERQEARTGMKRTWGMWIPEEVQHGLRGFKVRDVLSHTPSWNSNQGTESHDVWLWKTSVSKSVQWARSTAWWFVRTFCSWGSVGEIPIPDHRVVRGNAKSFHLTSERDTN